MLHLQIHDVSPDKLPLHREELLFISAYTGCTAEYLKVRTFHWLCSMQFDDVLEQFMPMIKGCISRWRLYGELEEFEQIGRIALHEAWEKYNPENGPFAPLAKSYVYGRIQQELTRQNRRRERSVMLENDHLLPDQEDTAGLICLLSFLQSLPLSGREMDWLRLYVMEGSGPSEIAERMGVSVHTVKGWRKQALQKLRSLAREQKLEW